MATPRHIAIPEAVGSLTISIDNWRSRNPTGSVKDYINHANTKCFELLGLWQELFPEKDGNIILYALELAKVPTYTDESGVRFGKEP
jgi:hypothetical protein